MLVAGSMARHCFHCGMTPLPTQALSRFTTTPRALLTLRVGTWSSLNRITCGPNSGGSGYWMDGSGEITFEGAEGRFRA